MEKLLWPYICENKWNVSGNGKQFFISLVCRIFSRYPFSILIMMAIFSLCFVFFLWFQFERSDFLSQCIKFLWFVFHSVRIFFWGDLDWTVFFFSFWWMIILIVSFLFNNGNMYVLLIRRIFISWHRSISLTFLRFVPSMDVHFQYLNFCLHWTYTMWKRF